MNNYQENTNQQNFYRQRSKTSCSCQSINNLSYEKRHQQQRLRANSDQSSYQTKRQGCFCHAAATNTVDNKTLSNRPLYTTPEKHFETNIFPGSSIVDTSKQRIMNQSEIQNYMSNIKKTNQKHISLNEIKRKLSGGNGKYKEQKILHSNNNTQTSWVSNHPLNDSNIALEFPVEYMDNVEHFLGTRFSRRSAVTSIPINCPTTCSS